MKVGVIACAGRMGRTLLREVLAAPDLELAGGIERPGHAALGQDLGALAGLEPAGIVAGADVEALIVAADVLIEFSTPEASLSHATIAAGHGKACVIGTTGLEPAQEAELRGLATGIPIVWAANMSVGVNLLAGLVQKVAATLGPEIDIEIVEMHHRHKVDAPSGTALLLGRAAAAGRGVELAQVADRGRDGLTGARREGAIGFAALRGGDVVGDHSVIFAGAGERLVLQHIATDRGIYAKGALRAARWVVGRAPGLYGVRDVLGLA